MLITRNTEAAKLHANLVDFMQQTGVIIAAKNFRSCQGPFRAINDTLYCVEATKTKSTQFYGGIRPLFFCFFFLFCVCVLEQVICMDLSIACDAFTLTDGFS